MKHGVCLSKRYSKIFIAQDIEYHIPRCVVESSLPLRFNSFHVNHHIGNLHIMNVLQLLFQLHKTYNLVFSFIYVKDRREKRTCPKYLTPSCARDKIV